MWQFYCSSVKLLCIAMMYVTAEGRSHQPGLEQHSEDHAVQGCQSIPMWLSVSEGTEQTHWKPLRKAVLGGRIKTTDVTFDIHRWLENLMGLGSFSAFYCVIYYLGRKVWIIFLLLLLFFFHMFKIKLVFIFLYGLIKNKWTDNIIITKGRNGWNANVNLKINKL